MLNEQLFRLLLGGLGDTLYMVFSATALAALLGIPAGFLLYGTRPKRFLANALIFYPLNLAINIGRSIPFIILAIWIIPLTRFLVGKAIGNTAAIVPLALAATPFLARLIENALNEVPAGLIEAAQAMGAHPGQIIRRVLWPEALPAIINALTITLITLIGYSAVVGSIGADGLGKIAYSHGYQRYRPDVIFYTVCVIVLLVQAIQYLGDYLVRRTDHR